MRQVNRLETGTHLEKEDGSPAGLRLAIPQRFPVISHQTQSELFSRYTEGLERVRRLARSLLHLQEGVKAVAEPCDHFNHHTIGMGRAECHPMRIPPSIGQVPSPGVPQRYRHQIARKVRAKATLSLLSTDATRTEQYHLHTSSPSSRLRGIPFTLVTMAFIPVTMNISLRQSSVICRNLEPRHPTITVNFPEF